MRKIQTAILAAALLFGTAAPTLAQTATGTALTNAQLIVTLQKQIADLQAKIAALQKAQTEVRQVSQDIGATLKLIGQLRQGMTSDDVKLLQSILAVDKDVYPEGMVSGYYGPLTAKAVMKFQKKHGLEAVGSVGPKTLAKINEMLKDAVKDEDDDGDDDEDDDKGKKDWQRVCLMAPPGHFVAMGLAKKGEDWGKKWGEKEKCWKLPPGIGKRLPPTGTTTPPIVDTAAPLISSILASGIASTSAMVSWTTNENATTKVYYGTTAPLNLGTASSVTGVATLLSAHSVLLSGLTASTTYYYVVESKDAANNTATSSELSFLTLP